MNELHLQDKFLIPFFTATDGSGLSYTEIKANTIDANSLMCESDLIEFLSTCRVNQSNYKKLLKKFKNKEDILIKELIEFLQSKIKDFRNMALFLNHNNSSFTFEGLKFYLFSRSDSQTNGDEDFEENIFSVVPDNELEGFEKKDEEKQYSIKKKKIYENPERIDAVSKHIVNNLVQVVYRQIRGNGKAMLATTSIKAAQMYKQKIEYYFKKKVKADKYKNYEDAPICVIYSGGQEQSKSNTLNDGLNEAKVLQKFVSQKNGIIIVVDKLQTGFDEPKLHTLFLDKEIRGISAIQTISRVNRTAKYKKDCKIVDFSYKNVNNFNIKEAYEHFSDVVVSDFDPLGELKLLELFYDDLKNSTFYKEYYNHFLKLCNDKTSDPEEFMDLENSFEKYINTHPSKSKELKQKINKYFRILGLIEYIIEFDTKYLEECLLKFFKKYNDIYNAINKPDDIDEVNIYFDDQIGIVEVSKIKEIKTHTPPTSGGESTGDTKTYKYKILEIIEKRNEEEADIGKLIEEFENLIKVFFEYVESHNDFNNLKAKMKGTQFSEDEIYNDFVKIYNSFLRRKKGEEWDFFKKNTKDLVEKLCDDFNTLILEDK
ncbi:MAG: hypothetical protein DRG78_04955 [Epsilonproteobacteria bacterium]|nr:MAG: hypothetical protein DRG78_04955 [Campylobacterota bacterium]